MKYTYRAALLIPVFLLLTGIVTVAQDCSHSYAKYWQYQGGPSCDGHATMIKKAECGEREASGKQIFECAPKGRPARQQCCIPQKNECGGQAGCGKEIRCETKSRQGNCRVENSQCRQEHHADCGINQCTGHKSAGCFPGRCEERKPGCNCSYCQQHKAARCERTECPSPSRHGAVYNENCKMIGELNQSRCIPKYYADDLMKRNEQCKRGCEQHTCGGTCASYGQSVGHLESLHGELQEMCRKHAGSSCQ